MMTPPLSSTALLRVLVLITLTRGGMTLDSPLTYRSAKSEFQRICAALSESSVEQNLTLVLVLFLDRRFEIPFDCLRKLPRALTYLSSQEVVLGQREREIVVSWERDQPDADPFRTKYWDPSADCGHGGGCGSKEGYYMQHYRLEKRVLIQIREWSPSDVSKEPLKLIRRRLQDIGWLGYSERFRAIFIMLRMENADGLHSQITVRRAGQIIGRHVLKLTADEFSPDHVRNLFRPQKPSLNRTDDFIPEFNEASFYDEGKLRSAILFESCGTVSRDDPKAKRPYSCHAPNS